MINVAIIGTGKIGIDLLYKIKKSKVLRCSLFVGRNKLSSGLQIAKRLKVPTSEKGISGLVDRSDEFQILFDATSAQSHFENAAKLKNKGKFIIDMTPSSLGKPIVPSVNLDSISSGTNVSMVSCGGQSSIPIASALHSASKQIDYIEVVSSIASESAGPATRRNIDEYIKSTESSLSDFTDGCASKVILILNPASPPIHMQTTISAKVSNPDIKSISEAIEEKVLKVKKHVPGYELLVPPKQIGDDRVVCMLKVTGCGDYLPSYAGNLDIINCAAIEVAEKKARTLNP